MNTAAKGRRAEHRSRDILAAAGYTVIRAAASKGPWDLVGYARSGWVLCQVKAGRHGIGKADLEVLREEPCPPRCLRLVHWWRPMARGPVVLEV